MEAASKGEPVRTRRLAVLVCVAAAARGAPPEEALGGVVELLDVAGAKARRAGGSCGQALLQPLQVLADDLEAQRGAQRGVEAWRFVPVLRELQSTAELTQCPPDLQARLAEAAARLEELRRRGPKGRPEPGAPTAEKRDCGTGADLGCGLTLEGVLPADREAYGALLQGLASERSEKKRARLALTRAAGLYLTAAQFTRLLDLFPGDEARLEVAEGTARRVVNLRDAQGYAARFGKGPARARYTQLVFLLLNPDAQPRGWRVDGDMDRVPFAFEADTREAVEQKCRVWKEGNIRIQGYVMRVAVKGRPEEAGMLATDAACRLVAEGATPLY